MLSSALMNVILNFIFIPKLGFIGASITTLISTIAYFLMAYFWSQKLFYIQRNLFQILIYIFFCLGLSIIVPFTELIYNFSINLYIKSGIFIAGLITPFIIGIVTITQIKNKLYKVFGSIKVL